MTYIIQDNNDFKKAFLREANVNTEAWNDTMNAKTAIHSVASYYLNEIDHDDISEDEISFVLTEVMRDVLSRGFFLFSNKTEISLEEIGYVQSNLNLMDYEIIYKSILRDEWRHKGVLTLRKISTNEILIKNFVIDPCIDTSIYATGAGAYHPATIIGTMICLLTR